MTAVNIILGGSRNASPRVTWPWTDFPFPWLRWERRESRAARAGASPGSSMKVQPAAFAQVAASRLPGARSVLAMPFPQNPVCYLLGFASSAHVDLMKARKPPPEPKAAAADGQAQAESGTAPLRTGRAAEPVARPLARTPSS